MEGTIRTEERELANRESGGLEVSLLWDPEDDALTVIVNDSRTGDAFALRPEKRRALDAFYHPYAKTARPGARPSDGLGTRAWPKENAN